MAAAEYFSNASMSQQAPPPYQQQAPTSHPSQNQTIPQVQTPPQHQQQSNQNHGVHFAATPVEVQQRHSFSGQRPNFFQNGWNQQPYYNNTNPYQQQNQALALQRPPQQFTSPHSSGYNSPHQRPQYLAPHMRPYANPNSSQYSLEHGYSSDPEPHRRKHKHKKRRDSDEKGAGKSRSTNKDAFLGAAGGGLIGDLIFPGLGTVGGAALGYFGGKDYARHRKEREGNRAVAQREWEEIHRPDRHHRDSSRDYSSRDSSNNQGQRSRQRSYERRKDGY